MTMPTEENEGAGAPTPPELPEKPEPTPPVYSGVRHEPFDLLRKVSTRNDLSADAKSLIDPLSLLRQLMASSGVGPGAKAMIDQHLQWYAGEARPPE